MSIRGSELGGVTLGITFSPHPVRDVIQQQPLISRATFYICSQN